MEEQTWFYEYHAELLRYFRSKWKMSSDDAEDLTAELFFRLLRVKRPPKSPRAYLYACARNVGADFFRRNHIATVAIDAALETLGSSDRYDDWEIRETFASLPYRMRVCLSLKAYGYSGKEAASIMETTPQGYRDLLMRSKRALKKMLAR